MSQERINRFYSKLYELKDWPDRDIIVAMSNIAKEDITNAPTFAQLIIQRLLDPSTNSTYRRPLFYLIDSLMKTVGGPYAAIFESHLNEVYSMTLKDIHNPQDIQKLNFLFTTWEERKFISGNLLSKMKYQLSQPQVVIHTTIQPIPMPQMMNNNYALNQNNNHLAGMQYSNNNNRMQNFSQGFQQQPSSIQQTQLPFQPQQFQQVHPSQLNHPTIDRETYIFKDLVGNEMVNVLNQLYNELQVTDRISLEEIAVENPDLYSQIKQTAEYNAEEILLKRMRNMPSSSSSDMNNIHSSNINHFPSRFENNAVLPAPVGRMTTNLTSDSSLHSRKRSLPEEFQDRNLIPNKQPSRNVNSQDNRSFFSENRSGGGSNIAANSLDRLFANNKGSANHGGQTAPHLTIPSTPTNALTGLYGKPQIALPQQGDFVNGYINETPVVIDIERVQTVTNQLANSTSVLSFDIAFANNLAQVSKKLVHRLESYLNDVKLPPALPPILFGPLPVEPLYQTLKPTTQAAAVLARKLPVPEFRISELNKKPDAALKALYAERPHQFHEDGLRFRTLIELRAHTDKYLNLKKISLKYRESKDKRESREWYCGLDNWISDFDSLNRKNTQLNKENETNQSSFNNGSTSTKVNAPSNIEFIIPADENFTRCPISREVFATVWDDEEGEMMFRNAVKVLITEAADPTLFKLAKPIPPESLENLNNVPIDDFRYMIVHKLLVMDRWLSEGKASTVKDAIQRYESIGERGKARIESLKVAAGEDEEEFEDIFTILEYSW